MSQGLMNVIIVQIRCKPGYSYKVADVLHQREICSNLYSTSGEWDLLAKIYPPKDADIGKFMNENVHDIEGVERTLTTLTFKSF